MALITAQGISAVALELLSRSLVLPKTCATVAGGEFHGPGGATITVRVRQARTAREQATPGAPIDFDQVNETAVDVTLRHLYDATRITDEDLSLAVVDFAAQVTAPQVAAVAIGAEDQVAAVMNAITPDLALNIDGTDVEDMLLAAREMLGEAEAPAGNRWLACSPSVSTMLLKLDKFSRVDASGSPSALRDALVGRIYGFNVVESAALVAGSALAYHSSGLLFASRAPAMPSGASNAATLSQDGIGIRQVFDYDVATLSDVSAVSTFAGASLVLEDGTGGSDRRRVVKLDSGGESS